MSKIVFIELKVASKERVVCDIVEKLFHQGNRILIYLTDDKKAVHMDNLLWTWKQDSFLPHGIASSTNDDENDPILLTTDASLTGPHDTLVLFDPLPSDTLTSFETVIDFAEVYHQEKIKDSRARYRRLMDDARFELEFSPLGAFLNS